MGATYLSMQLRTSNRDAVVAELRSVAAANAAAGLQFYVGEPMQGWLFFRNGKQLPWFKIAAGKSRKGKERDKLAAQSRSACRGMRCGKPRTIGRGSCGRGRRDLFVGLAARSV
jgi:hypothetical protein